MFIFFLFVYYLSKVKCRWLCSLRSQDVFHSRSNDSAGDQHHNNIIYKRDFHRPSSNSIYPGLILLNLSHLSRQRLPSFSNWQKPGAFFSPSFPMCQQKIRLNRLQCDGEDEIRTFRFAMSQFVRIRAQITMRVLVEFLTITSNTGMGNVTRVASTDEFTLSASRSHRSYSIVQLRFGVPCPVLGNSLIVITHNQDRIPCDIGDFEIVR